MHNKPKTATHRWRGKWLMAGLAATTAAASLGLSVLGAGSAAAATNGGSGHVRLPASGVESPPSGSVTETGSTLLYPLWNIWVPAFQEKYPHVSITTAGTGSGTGIAQASAGTVDIGSSDAYLSPSQSQADPTLQNIPVAISAQVVAYNIPGLTAHLKLSGKVLSEIYQGKITTWNDPAIASANPGVTLPNMPIVTLHRSDGSGDTFIFTQYLSKSDAAGWGEKISFNTTVPWPSAPGALGEQGNGGMVSGCKATPGCVAYVGISYLSQLLGDGLNYAQLQNGKGHYVMPTAASIEAEASHFTKKTPANGTISMIYGPVAAGYPIINYEYAIVNTHQTSATTAKDIRSLLEWAVNTKYGNSPQYLNQVNFQPLPPRQIGASLKQIEKISG
ncbi:MAG: phosphate ABC transporter substrate-binding protein PstS [Acidimicrobiales bacterium]|nr:phosphate ABC transporter substrate-binding protein PstS [Acidimicrobiales bacterium]